MWNYLNKPRINHYRSELVIMHTGLKLVDFTMCLPWFYFDWVINAVTNNNNRNRKPSNNSNWTSKPWRWRFNTQQWGKIHIAQPRFLISIKIEILKCIHLCVCICKQRSNLWTNKKQTKNAYRYCETIQTDSILNAYEWAWAYIYLYICFIYWLIVLNNIFVCLCLSPMILFSRHIKPNT